MLFHRTLDGPYQPKTKKGKKKKEERQAQSRIMITSAKKMRHFRIRGGGEGEHEAEDIDEVVIANVHFNNRTAKKDVKEGAAASKKFWDTLAIYLVEFGARFLCGDFNMALFCVVPELRARGFQIYMAAW